MYRFAGFFARTAKDRPVSLPEGAVWRPILTPFEGVGVRLPELLGESPDPDEVHRLLREVGLQEATDWLYLTYDCWGGRIDYVYGLGVRGRQSFGPDKESDVSKVREAYLTLMGAFGVQPVDALRFSPFVRGFWGEV